MTLTLILFLFAIAAYHLSLRLASQLYYLKGKQHLREGAYGAAAAKFTDAVACDDGDYRAWNHLGRAYHRLGRLESTGQAFVVAQKAEEAYEEAAHLNPLDSEAAFGLARETARLRHLFAALHPGENSNPYDATPHFRRALQLRPNGVGYHYAFARYLYEKGELEDLLVAVENMARIYPTVHTHLKSEPFWSPQVAAAVEKGLERAIDDGLPSDKAHVALSSLMADEENLSEAISHYEKALNDPKVDTPPDKYLHLGGLYLEDGQIERAGEVFSRALAVSDDQEKWLERVYGVYKSKGHVEAYHDFFLKVSQNLEPSPKSRILAARTLIDSGREQEAVQILNELNREQARAEAYYWLYRIAEKDQDFDRMELAIQKATVLEPANSQYHFLFSRLLFRLNKLDSAERQAGLAIEHAARPSPGLFKYRASIRWKKKDFQGAAEDWESALRLQPKSASLCAKIADAYINLGNRPKATNYYQRAAQLDPENKKYREKYNALATYAEPK